MTANDSCIDVRAHAFSEIFLNSGCWNPSKLQKIPPTFKNSFSAPKISDALQFGTDSKVLYFHSQIHAYAHKHIFKSMYVYLIYIYLQGKKKSSEKVTA